MIKNLIKLPIILVAIFILIMFFIDLLSTGWKFSFHYQTIISLIAFGFGVIIIAIGAYTFKQEKTTVNPMTPELSSHLVSKGIYGISRNPMYIGFLSWLLACALILGNIINFLLLPVFIFLVNKLYIIPEETALKKIFGDAFDEYANTVRRWI